MLRRNRHGPGSEVSCFYVLARTIGTSWHKEDEPSHFAGRASRDGAIGSGSPRGI